MIGSLEALSDKFGSSSYCILKDEVYDYPGIGLDLAREPQEMGDTIVTDDAGTKYVFSGAHVRRINQYDELLPNTRVVVSDCSGDYCLLLRQGMRFVQAIGSLGQKSLSMSFHLKGKEDEEFVECDSPVKLERSISQQLFSGGVSFIKLYVKTGVLEFAEVSESRKDFDKESLFQTEYHVTSVTLGKNINLKLFKVANSAVLGIEGDVDCESLGLGLDFNLNGFLRQLLGSYVYSLLECPLAWDVLSIGVTKNSDVRSRIYAVGKSAPTCNNGHAFIAVDLKEIGWTEKAFVCRECGEETDHSVRTCYYRCEMSPLCENCTAEMHRQAELAAEFAEKLENTSTDDSINLAYPNGQLAASYKSGLIPQCMIVRVLVDGSQFVTNFKSNPLFFERNVEESLSKHLSLWSVNQVKIIRSHPKDDSNRQLELLIAFFTYSTSRSIIAAENSGSGCGSSPMQSARASRFDVGDEKDSNDGSSSDSSSSMSTGRSMSGGHHHHSSLTRDLMELRASRNSGSPRGVAGSKMINIETKEDLVVVFQNLFKVVYKPKGSVVAISDDWKDLIVDKIVDVDLESVILSTQGEKFSFCVRHFSKLHEPQIRYVDCPLECGEEGIQDKDLEHHKQKLCSCRVVKCSIGCGKTMLAGKLESHIHEECPERVEYCDNCFQSVKSKLMTEHCAKSCTMRATQCSLCGLSLSANDLKVHLNGECPKRSIACSWCDEGVEFRLLNNHKIFHCTGRPTIENNLFEAVWSGSIDKVDDLLESGANELIQSASPNSPLRELLHSACCVDQPAIVEQLLSAKANVNWIDKFSQTALHIAASRGHVRCLKLLMDGKANVQIEDSEGRVPMDLAVAYSQRKCIKGLSEAWRLS